MVERIQKHAVKNVINISVDDLVENPKNPNILSQELFERLKLAIKRFGFVQPILVSRYRNGKYLIIDGNHRYKAAKELGYKFLPAIVSKEDSRVQSISMNKLRGYLDGNIVSELLSELVNDDWKVETLTLTGFNEEELLAMLNPSTEENYPIKVKPADLTQIEEKEEYTLEIRFTSLEHLTYVKKVLRKFGRGKGYAEGLLNLCKRTLEKD